MIDDSDQLPLSRRKFLVGVLAVPAVMMLADPSARGDIAVNQSGVAIPSMKISNAVRYAANPIPLKSVRLTGGPLKHAQDLDRRYLLQLEPDRMMSYFRVRAGLQPKAPGYGGWDGDGRNLTGHIAGHYLSAVSLMFAATGDRQLLDRANTMVAELSEVQNSDGYIGALSGGKEAFTALSNGEIRSGGFDLNGLWSPWYVEHKIFAGLRDAYRYTGNAHALTLQIGFAGWIATILSPLTDEQDQQMLNTEFGGMGEVLADLYADTGDVRWIRLSDRFEHRQVIDPLAAKTDRLGGLHANTQIPKLIGSMKRYIYTGSASDGVASEFFWDTVVSNHTYASGGHGKDEYFGPPDKLSERVDGRTDESCNVYNMLKLTRGLFALNPSAKYAEFQERALFNHALASIDPADGRMCYMVPIGRGVQHEYQDMFNDFTCCVGTGMENHALHGYGIYSESGDRMWINLYTPSTVDWQSQGVQLITETTFPEGSTASITIQTSKPCKFTLTLRRPSWAGLGFYVAVNGKAIATAAAPGSFFDVTRQWKQGDVVKVFLPKALHAEPLADNPDRVALMWGPLVLAGDMGAEPDDPSAKSTKGVPVYVAAGKPVNEWLKQTSSPLALFQSDGVGRETATGGPLDLELTPFYRLHRRTYAAYWDLYTPEAWQEKSDELVARQAEQAQLDAKTVAFVQPGEMQAERDFNEQGEDSSPELLQGRHGRRGSNWFSFDIPVDPANPMTLRVTYSTEEFAKRAFNILADGVMIASQTIDRTQPGSSTATFYDSDYLVPPTVTAGKTKVTILFRATAGAEIAAVYGIRMMRSNPAP